MCNDDLDPDCDGLVDCSDPDCATSPFCTNGGLCASASTLTCGASTMGTTVGGTQRFTQYACDPMREFGPEAIYRIAPPAGTVTLTLGDFANDLDLIVLEETATGTCEPRSTGCIAASSTESDETVTFTARAGVAYYVIVDGYGNDAGAFTLGVSCN